jgi:hypothetical protein
VEVEVVASPRMKIGGELCVRPDAPRWLFEYAFAFSVADDVVCLAGDGLSSTHVSQILPEEWS